jgi:hypothetical protein
LNSLTADALAKIEASCSPRFSAFSTLVRQRPDANRQCYSHRAASPSRYTLAATAKWHINCISASNMEELAFWLTI